MAPLDSAGLKIGR